MAARRTALMASLGGGRSPAAPITAGAPALVLIALLLSSLPGAGMGAPGVVRAAEPYRMETATSYLVAPDERSADVAIAVTFENTTPDPAGRYSVYGAVPIAIHDGATAVAARDASGALTVAVKGSAPTVATIQLRTPLRYGKTASFTVGYHLADGASRDVRIRSAAVVLPIWSFGTSGAVRVRLPSAFTVTVQGDGMTSSANGDETILDSGPIADPASWLALLTATRASELRTVQRSVALRGGTLDLQVRSWSDDTAWGVSTLDLLSTALPRLQTEIGLDYTGIGPVVITEALPTGSGAIPEAASGAQEIAVAFDATPFTVLHQAAHLWLGAALIGDRWIREGIASEVASRVAGALADALPYEPADETAARAAAAMPLASWGVEQANAAGAAADAFGFAASWDLVDRLTVLVGADGIREVLARASAGVGGYEALPAGGVPAAGLGPAQPLDSRSFLDQLEQVSGRDLAPLFAARVFGTGSARELSERAAARSAYEALSAAAGDWGVPEVVRTMMERWEFSAAQSQMAAASAWLAERDSLVDEVRAAGLALPGRVEDLWRVTGGDDAARRELGAERAIVAAYRSADAAIAAAPNPIERLGLLGAPLPRELLATAAGLFAAGDLASAADRITQALTADRDAQPSGVVRLAVMAAVLAVIAAAILLLVRRRRPAGYTAPQ